MLLEGDWVGGGARSTLLEGSVEFFEFGESLLVVRYLLVVVIHVLSVLLLHLAAERV